MSPYTHMKQAVLDYAGRPDLDNQFDTFLLAAEACINRDIRNGEEGIATYESLPDNAAGHELPEDYLNVVSVFSANGQPITYVPISTFFKDVSAQGLFTYTISGNRIYTTQDFRLVYLKKITSLDSVIGKTDGRDHWIYQGGWDVYLNALLKQVMLFTEDDQGAIKFEGLYMVQIKAVNKTTASRNVGSFLRRHNGRRLGSGLR